MPEREPFEPPLNFTQIETLRSHMLLTIGHMARIFGVSRVTYHGWVKGSKIRKSNDGRVRDKLRLLLVILREGWPQPEIIAMKPKERIARLLELLEPQE